MRLLYNIYVICQLKRKLCIKTANIYVFYQSATPLIASIFVWRAGHASSVALEPCVGEHLLEGRHILHRVARRGYALHGHSLLASGAGKVTHSPSPDPQ